MANVLKEDLRRRQRRGIHLPTDEDDRSFDYGSNRRESWWDRFDRQEEYDEESESLPAWTYYEEVWMVPGPYVGIGPRGYRRSDERIHDEIISRLTQHGRIDAREIQVEVKDGQVILKGDVDNRQHRRMIEDSIEGVSGVTDIHNQLRVREGSKEESPSRGVF